MAIEPPIFGGSIRLNTERKRRDGEDGDRPSQSIAAHLADEPSPPSVQPSNAATVRDGAAAAYWHM
jgi:hypothetical protein